MNMSVILTKFVSRRSTNIFNAHIHRPDPNRTRHTTRAGAWLTQPDSGQLTGSHERAGEGCTSEPAPSRKRYPTKFVSERE